MDVSLYTDSIFFDLEYVLLDLDGTIVASAQGISNAILYAAEKLDLCVDASTTERFIGPPISHYIQNDLCLDELQTLEFTKHFRHYYAQRGYREFSIYPGMIELVDQLHSSGRKIFVCTSKREGVSIQMLEDIGIISKLHGVVGANLECYEKVDVLARLLREHSVSPERAVMIGDRSTDIYAAKARGTYSIGVSYGYGGHNELVNSSPDAIAATVGELKDLLIYSMASLSVSV